jgi:hypothetical protein
MITKWNQIPLNEDYWVCLNELGECIVMLKLKSNNL